MTANSEPTEPSTKHYWNEFYSCWKNRIPSQFASLVATEVEAPSTIVDIGCGNGRDAFFFASLGHRVYGLDRSETAVALNTQTAAEMHLEHCQFWQVDVGKSDQLVACLREAGGNVSGSLPLAIYARFFIHSITDAEEATLFGAIRAAAPAGTTIFLEFRNDKDAQTPKVFGQHYRRFVSSGDLSERLRAGGIEVAYLIDGQGMAKYKNEDPFITRIIARVR